MLPRCWLLRRSERLEHNQCHGLFILHEFHTLLDCSPGRAIRRSGLLWCHRIAKGQVAMKERLENVVLQMYRAGVRCSEAMREFQKTFILTVLKDQRGNQCRAAEKLGMHRNTLRRTIRELEIDIGPTRAMGKRRPARSEVPMAAVRRQAT